MGVLTGGGKESGKYLVDLDVSVLKLFIGTYRKRKLDMGLACHDGLSSTFHRRNSRCKRKGDKDQTLGREVVLIMK